MSFSPASTRNTFPALAVAFLVLLVACGDGERSRTPTQPPLVHPPPNPTWEAMAEESAGAVVGALTWALENAGSVESLGEWDPTIGAWRVAAALPFGQPADLRVQFRNQEGSVRKHYVDGTTAEIRVSGRVSGEASLTELDATIHAIEPGGARALAEWSGGVTSGETHAPFIGRANPLWRHPPVPLPLYVLNGSMSLRFGQVDLILAFYGNVVVGNYAEEYPPGFFNEFSFALQPFPGQS